MTRSVLVKLGCALISISICVYLLSINSGNLDVAATKNNALTHSLKNEIDMLENVDSVKTITKNYLDVMKESRQHNSTIATKNIFGFSALILLQIIILFRQKQDVKRLNHE